MKKILLLGDSISIGYREFVKAAFLGVAEVIYPHKGTLGIKARGHGFNGL